MKTSTVFGIIFAFLAVSSAGKVFAAGSQPFQFNGHDYYIVNGNDSSADTGNKVCDKAGRKCEGYTDLGTEACKYFHPDASITQSVNGSKSGFYCNGAPQKGLACAASFNNCQVCPACNVNADCDTQIGDQFREMYADCGPSQPGSSGVPSQIIFTQKTASAWTQFVSFVNKTFSSLWSGLVNIWNGIYSTFTKTQTQTTLQIQNLTNNNSLNVPIPADSQACEFVQTKVKLVTCGAYKAADNFCAITMQSPAAWSLSCQDNGAIVCDVPCKTTPAHQPIKTCPFNNDRPRGNQAPPLGSCN